MKYIEPKQLSKIEIEELLNSSEIDKIKDAVISAALYQNDYNYIVQILYNLDISNLELAKTFLFSASTLVRRFLKIDESIKNKVTTLCNNESLKGLAEDVIDDISVYVKS